MLKSGDIIQYEESGNIVLVLTNNETTYLKVYNGSYEVLKKRDKGAADYTKLCNIVDLLESVIKELK